MRTKTITSEKKMRLKNSTKILFIKHWKRFLNSSAIKSLYVNEWHRNEQNKIKHITNQRLFPSTRRFEILQLKMRPVHYDCKIDRITCGREATVIKKYTSIMFKKPEDLRHTSCAIKNRFNGSQWPLAKGVKRRLSQREEKTFRSSFGLQILLFFV